MNLKAEHIVVSLLSLVVVAVVWFAPNDMTKADPSGCLLTTQALLNEGTFALDSYPDRADPANYKYESRDGHVYYALAFGTSMICVPAVWVAQRLGMDMSGHDEAVLQRILAALIVGCVFVLGWLIARLLLPPIWALGFTLATVFGTSLSSSLGTALWNTGFESVAILGALYLVVRRTIRGVPLNPFVAGLLLGLALFCRPTAGLAIVMVGSYILVTSRRDLGMYVLGVLCWIVALIVISRLAYGLWIPPYYQALGQGLTWGPGIVLQGMLISPGRGVLFFSPVLLVILLWPLFRGLRIANRGLMLGGILWFVLHVLLMARHVHWWGGHCFGPRLLTDAMPVLIPVGALVVADARSLARPALRRVSLGLLIVLAVIGIGVHTFQGLYNPETILWNKRPNIDPYVRYVFDWRYPQPLETPRRRLDRRIDASLPGMQSLAAGEWASVGVGGYTRYYGWSKPKSSTDGIIHRSAEEMRTHIAAVLEDSPSDSLLLRLRLMIANDTQVQVLWNGIEIGVLGPSDGAYSDVELPVSAVALAAVRHCGDSYGPFNLVPKQLRVDYGGMCAHEIEFIIINKATGAAARTMALLKIGDFRWIQQPSS